MPPITRAILNAIRKNQSPVSKAELVKITRLSLATINEHVEFLLRSNLILESEIGPSTGGRKPRLLSFNAELGYIVTIDLESVRAKVGIADLDCRIISSEYLRNIDVGAGPLEVLEKIKDLVFKLMNQLQIRADQIKGVGMGLPGPVKHSSGTTTSLSIMPGWENYEVGRFWKQHFECPCRVDNNVNTMALAEHSRYPDPDKENMICVKIGNGIGASIIVGGRIYRGANDYAGGIGHINIGHDTLCYCGNRGCLEAIAGGRAIAVRAEQLASSGQSVMLKRLLDEKGALTLSDVRKAVVAADPVASELMRECGNAIGNVLSGLVNFFNPSSVYIGGSVSEVGNVLLAAIRQAIYQHSLPLTTRNLSIHPLSTGEDAGIIGAAVLIADEIIAGNYLPQNALAKWIYE